LGSEPKTVHRAGDDREREDLAIRFVNTAAWRLREPAEERLPDANALLDWLGRNCSRRLDFVSGTAFAWRAKPASGEAAYLQAIALREAIYEILVARIGGMAPPEAALNLFNDLLARSMPGANLAWEAGELTWNVRSQSDALDVLKPIIISAAELMAGTRAGRVKQCQDERGCGWLFVDESRAQNRRWCAMGDCGNRAKAHRHYQRARRPSLG
jgi:predicted RNA-binding Zn ribbon-like protein